jgi:hypothetical protein
MDMIDRIKHGGDICEFQETYRVPDKRGNSVERNTTPRSNIAGIPVNEARAFNNSFIELAAAEDARSPERECSGDENTDYLKGVGIDETKWMCLECWYSMNGQGFGRRVWRPTPKSDGSGEGEEDNSDDEDSPMLLRI